MPSSPNKGYTQPAFNTLVGTWGTEINTNFSGIVDANLAGIVSVSLSNTNVTLTSTQAQNLTIVLTGTLTANVTVKTPCIGFFFIVNNTTGNFAVTLLANFGAGDIGSGIIAPQGVRLFLVSDTTSGVQYAAAPSASALVGEFKAYAGTSAPTGWLLCYGQAVSRTIYAALFAVISINYGAGDGSTTFNVPDLRGRAVAGFDNMGGVDAGRLDWSNSINTSGGEQYHTLNTSEMPSHTHGDSGHTHPYSIFETGSGVIAYQAGGNAFGTTGATTGSGNANLQNTGGGTAHNTMQPTLLCTWLIKI